MKIKKVIFSFIILFLVILLIPLFLPMTFRDYNQIFLGVTPTGILQIAGAAPQVLNIYADDKLAYYKINEIDKPIYDTDCNVQSVKITAEIYDENGNCDQMDADGSGNVYAYICNASTTGSIPYCDENNWNFRLNDVFTVENKIGLVCNLTANLDWSFYQRWGNWSINITVEDPDDPLTLTNTSNGTFYRTSHQEFIYPPGGAGSCSQGSQVNLGTVDTGVYNNGTACGAVEMQNGCFLKNVGNIRLNISWNATNFTGPQPATTHHIDVRYGNFAIDNDTVHTDGQEVYMSDDYITQVEFPTDSDRVERCGGFGGVDCDDDEDGNTYAAGTSKARFDVYWHINVPFGLLGGSYQNQIWGSQHKHEDGW